MLKKWLLIAIPSIQLQAQTGPSCILKDPIVTINFGTGKPAEPNTSSAFLYRRVEGSCPTDGHYSYTSYTSECFRGDWITSEDHTPGDVSGNMLLVNAAYNAGEFFRTMIMGLNPGKKYEFAVWMQNVCKPSDKCPYPLLPNITVRLETVAGKTVSESSSGYLERYDQPQWKKYSMMFEPPTGNYGLVLFMIDNSPGGCGNDFAVDDITVRECVPPPPPPITVKKNVPTTKNTATAKSTTSPVKKTTPATSKKIPSPEKEKLLTVAIPDSLNKTGGVIKLPPVTRLPIPAPPALTSRENSLVKEIETNAGEIRIDLYDNGEIDDDTVSIYHNNKLILSRARLSQKPLSIQIAINSNEPHHELVMVANNLGSIPPNTSLMIVTAGSKRYRLFISSTEQKNAKVVFDLKE
ncbi:MAG TPA: hypothetical protein VFI06_02845 [Chitinophagaceae bacterium]|nr:hypothetical protein [Chitinophagaceae bacterium]